MAPNIDGTHPVWHSVSVHVTQVPQKNLILNPSKTSKPYGNIVNGLLEKYSA
jgi:hypothetical protein